jgi:uncharacterized protein with GYD domain
MAMYMVQFSYTVDGWRALMKNPEDRSKALGAAASALGAKLTGLYYCFGDYDGVAMLEAPDDTTAGSVVLAAVSGGHVSATKTTKLLSVSEAMEMMGKAGGIVYAAPKG